MNDETSLFAADSSRFFTKFFSSIAASKSILFAISVLKPRKDLIRKSLISSSAFAFIIALRPSSSMLIGETLSKTGGFSYIRPGSISLLLDMTVETLLIASMIL